MDGNRAADWKRVLVCAASALILLGGMTAFSRQESGHERMLKLLEEVRRNSNLRNSFTGAGNLQDWERRLEALPSAADAETRSGLLVSVGMSRLRLGFIEEALERLHEAEGLLDHFAPERRTAVRASLFYYLGLAYLRKGESDNCVTLHHAESCLLPISDKGVHQNPDGSRKAIGYLRQVMELAPEDSAEWLASRWLLNIAAMTLGIYPDGLKSEERISPEIFESDADFPRFRNVAHEVGLHQVNLSGGAIAEDFTGNGLLDIVTSSWAPDDNLLFFANSGDGRFQDRSSETGLGEIMGGLNLVHADYDNDGDFDILVLRGAWLSGENGRIPNSLLRNENGRFVDVTFEAGLGDAHFPTQTAAWADYNNNGLLDLYIGNEATPRQRFPSQLFRNNGDGTFTDVAREAGVENYRFAKGVAWGDFNNNGFPDLYVSNLGGPNRLYLNQGDGTFRDVAEKLGVIGPIDSFPVWFWDYNNDGQLDLFVSTYLDVMPPQWLAFAASSFEGRPYPGELSHLYEGQSDGTFREVAAERGLDKLAISMGANFGDLDNDGFLDFYLGTGYPFYDGLVPNLMYWNRRGGRFLEVSASGGFAHLQKGHAVVFADFNQNGAQDVFQQMGGAYPVEAYNDALYENPGFENHWIKVRLRGVRSNRAGVGARIRVDIVEGGKERSIFRTVQGGGSFGSSSYTQHIGVGKAEEIKRLEVYWPASKTRQSFSSLPADRLFEIGEGAAEPIIVELTPFRFSSNSRQSPHHLDH